MGRTNTFGPNITNKSKIHLAATWAPAWSSQCIRRHRLEELRERAGDSSVRRTSRGQGSSSRLCCRPSLPSGPKTLSYYFPCPTHARVTTCGLGHNLGKLLQPLGIYGNKFAVHCGGRLDFCLLVVLRFLTFDGRL